MKRIIILSLSVIILFMFVTGIVIRGNKNQFTENFEPVPTKSSTNLKTFKSSGVMDFTIEVPETFMVEEKFGSVNITSTSGSIRLNQNATNYSNLEDHLKMMKELNKTIFKKINDFEIKGLDAQLGTINKERIYFIYVDYNVYSLATEDAQLFAVLDQIAQSFQYTPD